MKDAKIYDGTGWQSLKGPPGPSEPSTDAGNIITKGSDGLLRVMGETQYSGTWQPTFVNPVDFNEDGLSFDGFWVRAGRLVTLFITSSLDPNIEDTHYLIGLPFTIAETLSPFTFNRSLYAGVVISAEGEIIGTLTYGAAREEPYMSLVRPDAGGSGFSVTFTYVTDDQPMREVI